MNHSITNELIAKISDFQFMEDELEARNLELRQAQETIRDLDRANGQLGQQLEKVSSERDKLRAYAVNITARLTVVSESVANIIREASRSAVAEASHIAEQRQERPRRNNLSSAHASAVGGDISAAEMVSRLPTNEYR